MLEAVCRDVRICDHADGPRSNQIHRAGLICLPVYRTENTRGFLASGVGDDCSLSSFTGTLFAFRKQSNWVLTKSSRESPMVKSIPDGCSVQGLDWSSHWLLLCLLILLA